MKSYERFLFNRPAFDCSPYYHKHINNMFLFVQNLFTFVEKVKGMSALNNVSHPKSIIKSWKVSDAKAGVKLYQLFVYKHNN